MRTIQEVSTKTLTLENYLLKCDQGVLIPYSQIEKEAKIEMSEHGKQFMRSALNRMKMPYETVRKTGIILCAKINAMNIVTHSVKKIDRAVKKGAKTIKRVDNRVGTELDPPARKKLDFLRGNLSGVAQWSDLNRRLMNAKEPEKITKVILENPFTP